VIIAAMGNGSLKISLTDSSTFTDWALGIVLVPKTSFLLTKSLSSPMIPQLVSEERSVISF
jgi:hypothetical protein